MRLILTPAKQQLLEVANVFLKGFVTFQFSSLYLWCVYQYLFQLILLVSQD